MADKDEIMLYYSLIVPYPTRWSLLMQDLSLGVLGVLAVMMLLAFVGWLIVFVLLTILLPIHLFGFLQPEIRKIALRLQNKLAHSKPVVSHGQIIIGRAEEAL